MTRAARRVTTLLLALMAAMTSVALLAAPAMAADEAEHAASGFGTGQWDGLLLAAVVGAIVGVIVFVMSKPGEIHRVDAHHGLPASNEQMAP